MLQLDIDDDQDSDLRGSGLTSSNDRQEVSMVKDEQRSLKKKKDVPLTNDCQLFPRSGQEGRSKGRGDAKYNFYSRTNNFSAKRYQ